MTAESAKAAAMLREQIEAMPNAVAMAELRRQIGGWVDGGAVRAPAGRPAAVAREVLAAAGIEADVIERTEDPTPTPSPPAKNPAPERRRKRRSRRKRAVAPAGDDPPRPAEPRQPAPRSDPPEQTGEQRADVIAAERPAEVADAIRANPPAMIPLPDGGGDSLIRVAGVEVPARFAAEAFILRCHAVRPQEPAAGERTDRALIDLARALGVLADAVDRLPRTLARARLATVSGRLTRQPAVDTALLPAIEVAAVSVDGAPVASRDLRPRRAWRPARQRSLHLVGPRTLNGVPFDPLLVAADGIASPTTRADTLRLARIGFALTRPMSADVATFARLLTGKSGRLDPRRDLPRARAALAVLRGLLLTIDPAAKIWLPLAEVTPLDLRGERYALGPPAWRLTGGLFRPGLRSARDTFSARALDGIESSLAYSPPQTGARTPALLLPASGKTGPGPEVRIDGRDALRLASVRGRRRPAERPRPQAPEPAVRAPGQARLRRDRTPRGRGRRFRGVSRPNLRDGTPRGGADRPRIGPVRRGDPEGRGPRVGRVPVRPGPRPAARLRPLCVRVRLLVRSRPPTCAFASAYFAGNPCPA